MADKISIYSKMADSPYWRIERAADGLSTDPTWSGEVPELRDAEDIFRFFNRVDDADCERLEASGYTLPSLSVGDVVTMPDGRLMAVASAGFAAAASPPGRARSSTTR
jgi:hypothetical protein